MTSAHTAGAALGEARALIARLGQVVEDRMSKTGHPYALITWESRGVCPPYECSARCVSYRALFVEALQWLEDNADPSQLDLFSEAS